MQSLWMREALASEEESAPCPPLDADITADVAIVGGGYTGLWTALELKEADPSLDVVLLEKDICGAGGSGANAGLAVSLWVQFELLERMCGTEEALRLCRESTGTIAGIAEFCRAHGIALDHRPHGTIWAAVSPAQSGHWHSIIEALERHQERPFQVLTGEEIAERTGSRAFVEGVLEAANAVIDPGRLVRGLRRVALERGVRIFEGSAMTGLERTRPPRVRTAGGAVSAGKVVLALYAWSLALPELRGAIAVLGCDLAATAPCPAEVSRLGLAEAPGLMDARSFVEAIRTTGDGRMVFNKSGGDLPFGSGIDSALGRPWRSHDEMRRRLAVYYPDFREARFETRWAGPIDRTKPGLPLFGRLPASPDILYGYGYSGSGIALTRMGSRILASLALGRDDVHARAGLIREPTRDFPWEPFRYLGGRLVHNAIARKDELDLAGRKPGPVTRALLRLTPGSYKPTSANSPG